MAKARNIIAKDCMPFFKEKREVASGAIVVDDRDNSLILSKLNDALVHISVDDRDYLDDDSKLAYSPYENSAFIFSDNERKRVWQAGRYVGSALIDGTRINIHPRFGQNTLIAMLDDVCHFKYVSSSNEQRKGDSWNEIVKLIVRHLWIRKFASADKYGLPRKTVKRTLQSMNIRGHINVCKSILPYHQKLQAVSEYREKDIDATIGAIVYKAYDLLTKGGMNKSFIPTQLQESINQLCSTFHVQEYRLEEANYKKISYKSIYQSWKPLVDFSWSIIKQNAFSMTDTIDKSGGTIFLDMAEIWESFLRRYIGEVLAKDNYGNWETVSKHDCEVMVYENQFYSRKIIPDLLFRREYNGRTQYIVLDAKYKRMRGEKNDVDRSDFFQIHSYIQYFSSLKDSEVILGGLIYPLESEVPLDRNTAMTLFGINENTCSFIVDGISLVCDIEDGNKESIQKLLHERIEQMIDKWNVIKCC